MNCVFCKIIEKKIPSYVVYEDEEFLAFLDIAPVSKGHTILIPKIHSDNILQADKIVLSKMLIVAQDIARKLVDRLEAKGVNFLNNCGEIAGQTAFHTHLHIVPRYDNNDGFALKFNQDKHDKVSLEAILELLK